jgi:hypothetical protein
LTAAVQNRRELVRERATGVGGRVARTLQESVIDLHRLELVAQSARELAPPLALTQHEQRGAIFGCVVTAKARVVKRRLGVVVVGLARQQLVKDLRGAVVALGVQERPPEVEERRVVFWIERQGLASVPLGVVGATGLTKGVRRRRLHLPVLWKALHAFHGNRQGGGRVAEAAA